jgi:RNA polymerase sigma-70 factor (ECF subfamily)
MDGWNRTAGARVKSRGTDLERPGGKGQPADLLVEAFRKGKPGAFEAIVRAHQDRVYSFCARMLSDREDALDAAQEVFLSAWRNLAGFRGEAALSTWLLRIAANRCLNRIRRRKSLSEREAPWPESPGEEGGGIIFQPAGDEADRPDRLAENGEMGEILTEALSRLDPGSRWMVLLSDVEGFSYEEIATLADVPVGTVKSRLHRARMAMRRLLSPVA